MGILKKLLDSEYKELKRFDKLADEIISSFFTSNIKLRGRY